VLDSQYLALRLVANLQRDEIIAGCRNRRLVTETSSATAAASGPTATKGTEAWTTRHDEELSELLKSAGERALNFLRSFTERGAETTSATSASASTAGVTLPGSRIPCTARSETSDRRGLSAATAATTATTTPSSAESKRRSYRRRAIHYSAHAVECWLRHRARFLE
jgi:hypothetical protein